MIFKVPSNLNILWFYECSHSFSAFSFLSRGTLLNLSNPVVWRRVLDVFMWAASPLYHKCHQQHLQFPFQKGQGAPGREPVISHEEQKEMMLYYYRKQEELKVSVPLVPESWAALTELRLLSLSPSLPPPVSATETGGRRRRFISKCWVGRQPCSEKAISRCKRHQMGSKVKLCKPLLKLLGWCSCLKQVVLCVVDSSDSSWNCHFCDLRCSINVRISLWLQQHFPLQRNEQILLTFGILLETCNLDMEMSICFIDRRCSKYALECLVLFRVVFVLSSQSCITIRWCDLEKVIYFIGNQFPLTSPGRIKVFYALVHISTLLFPNILKWVNLSIIV